MTDRPTVLFCVGAAKAGTTWLFDHLSTHPDCHLRSIKELHYFTCVESGRFRHQIRVQQRRAAALATVERGSAAARKLADVTDWAAVIGQQRENTADYLAYLKGGRAGQPLVADMTPAYALLPEARLRAMARLTDDVRFLYLLRDPVARLWSHVRMLARRATGPGGFAAAASALMNGILDGAPSGAVARGDYASIVTRLGRAVDPSRLMILFQDDMMTEGGLQRLSAFLGIRPRPGQFARRVHEGLPLALSEAQAARARIFLDAQYDFVRRHLGELPPSWRMPGSAAP